MAWLSFKSIDIALGALLLICPISTIQANSFTWEGPNTVPGSNLKTPGNWVPSGPPGAGDNAIFDSTLPNISLTPTASGSFNISTFEFPNSANLFSFTFDNGTLQFDGAGSIIGTQTNPLITCNNTDNETPLDFQVFFSNSTSNSTGSGTFTVNNSGTLSGTVSNANVSEIYYYDQIYAPEGLTIPEGTTLIVTNTGTNNATGGGANQIASVGTYQLNGGISGNLTVGDFATLSLSNMGTDTSVGVGGNSTVYVGSALMGTDGDLFAVGDNVTINLSNSGTFTGANSTTYEQVAYVGDELLYVDTPFQAGNYFTLNITNTGTDASTGLGDNYVGAVDENFAYFENPFSCGTNASISLYNQGTCTGAYTSGNCYVGYIGGAQIEFDDVFTPGDYLSMSAINIGIDTSEGAGGNSVGVVDDTGQVYFDDTVTLGNYATITLSNSGTNTCNGTNPGYVGYISGDQLSAYSPFTAGTNLTIAATNEGNNTGNQASQVGYIFGSQINFYDTCALSDGTLLTAANNGEGVVNGPQIFFQNGFTLTGKATFQATNQGSVGQGQGISVGAGIGGDVNIILSNNQLFISSPEETFTIGALNGDACSSVQSNPELIIDMDIGVGANFAGAIQNFGQGTSSLTITGSGIQTLSGANTFTGMTTLDSGTLILTGSLAGDLNIHAGGMLQGTGSVLGSVFNSGTISPGQSIGTLQFLNGFTNSGGGYSVEVNGTGESDLISVVGTAAIDGGLVTVSSADGEYAFHYTYTILEATQVTGAYANVIATSPFIIPTLSQDPSHIYLTLTTDIAKAADTCSQLAVAGQLDGILDPTAQQSLLLSEIVNLSTVEVQAALNSLSGDQHALDFAATALINRAFIRRLYDPLRQIVTTLPNCCCSPCCEDFSAWLEGGGNYARIKGRHHIHGGNLNGYEITGGLQKTFVQDWTVGLAGSYDYEHVDFNRHGGIGKNKTWLVGLYGLYRPSQFYSLIDLAYGYSDNSLDRHIPVGSLYYRAHSKPKVSQFTFYGEVGVDFSLGCVLIQPFAGIEAEAYYRNRVKESYANGWGLNVRHRSYSGACGRFGVHLTTAASTNCKLIDISLDLACDRQFNTKRNVVHQHFEEFGTEFDVEGIPFNRTSFDYALTLSTLLSNNWRIYLEGSGESWRRVNQFNILAGVLCNW